MTRHIHHGNNLHILPTFADATFDSIVTDPPYELGFMGKHWDATGIAYNIDLWRECLRVLKPGWHLLAFGGTRTYHRMACAIEDAGFEIRDSIHWLYGSGFPKSLDVSKAIDKMDAAEEQQARRYRFTEWVRSTGVTARQIDDATGTMMGNHYTTHPTQPCIMTREHLEACRHLLGHIPDWVKHECDIRSVESKNFAQREVIGVQRNAMAGWKMDGTTKFVDRDITTPATDAARQWDGWGTALKPAHEPIILARRPFDGTVAHNVLTHGTGALNINACRIGDGGHLQWSNPRGIGYHGGAGNDTTAIAEQSNLGRWPANIILSEELAEQHPEWAHYYYCPKASTTERNTGLDELQANIHPTVKPLALMRWLIRLVTPPNGHTLDPFAGSGTTLTAAILEGFHATGIELNTEYLPIIYARTQWATTQPHQETLDL